MYLSACRTCSTIIFFSFNQSHYCSLALRSVRSRYFCSSNRLFFAVGIYTVVTHLKLLSRRLARCSKEQCWDPSLKQRKNATRSEIHSKSKCFNYQKRQVHCKRKILTKRQTLQTSFFTFGYNSILV